VQSAEAFLLKLVIDTYRSDTRLFVRSELLALPLPASALCLGCTCTASADVVSFGTYNPLGSNVDAAGNVRVTCSGLVGLTINYSIALNKGVYSASFSPRQMGSGINRLNYNLYTSNSYGTIWGDGTGGSGDISDSYIILLSSTSRDYPVYGRIPGSQTSTKPGSYSDLITVTVTYN
jgi:spore coat protein U-like protein